MVFSANSQDRPLGEGKRKWALNNCPSLPTAQGGGAHLFVADLGTYRASAGASWADQVSEKSEERGAEQRIARSILLSTGEDDGPSDVGSLTELYHPGGIDVVGDFVYVGFDGQDHKSYLKVFDMADPTRPSLVGGRGFSNHKSQAVGATDLADGRILLAVVDTNHDDWQIHFYVESTDIASGKVERHQFIRAGTWMESETIGKRTQEGFPFLKYQSLALLRECGTNEIYLVGINNDRRLQCGGKQVRPGFRAPTRVDVYRVHPPDLMGSEAEFELAQIVRRNMRDHTGEGCAGATAYITPEGQIVGYTIEHGGSREGDAGNYPEGSKRWVGKVRFYEYSLLVDIQARDDEDRISQRADLCPDEAEDFDGLNDRDGCPDEDNDADGIPDADDRCPNLAEDRDGINDYDGCREAEIDDLAGQRLVIAVGRLFGDAQGGEILPSAHHLLDEAAQWWRKVGSPKLCVAGHTNSYGNEPQERAETEQWAATVGREMNARGVPAGQLSTQGLGASRLIVAPASPNAEHLNIRVELAACKL
jgi:outer membrane protein OmpA-like peptidoglycan-associated protein